MLKILLTIWIGVYPLPSKTFTWNVEVMRGITLSRSTDKLIIRRSAFGDVVSVTIISKTEKTYNMAVYGKDFLQEKVDDFITKRQLNTSERVMCYVDSDHVTYPIVENFTCLEPYIAPADTKNWDLRLDFTE